MVTFTVIAGLVTPPEDGVTTMVDVLDPPPAGPLQPATSTKTNMAPSIPRRVRNRRASGSMKSRPIASMTKSTCRSNADGGTFMDCGGTRKDAAVIEPIAGAAGFAAFVVCTEHEVISAPVPGAQVKATGPMKPPEPRTLTVNDPVAPRATVMAAAEAEKSHAVPFRTTVCGLPLAESVTVMALATGPGAVVALGLNVRVRTQVVPPGETVSTTGRVQVLFVIVNGSAIGTEIVVTVSGTVVLGSLIVTVCVALVVVSSWPANVRAGGVNKMAPAVVLPVPVSDTVRNFCGWGALGMSALSGVSSVATFKPGAEGAYVTPSVQEAPAGSDSAAVQVLPAAGAMKSMLLPEVAFTWTVKGKVMAEVELLVMVKKNG